MKRVYKITSHNSEVLGYPGREFDWTKFDWKQETEHDNGCLRYSCDSEFIPKKLRGKLIGIKKAPKPWVDDGLIEPNCQYLHVPFDWAGDGTIYRVRPNYSMRAGNKYRGHLVTQQTAELINGEWCWCLYSNADGLGE